MLKARNLQVSIRRSKILRGIALEAPAGNFTVVVGPNGAGKSTLLRALTGETAYEGYAELNGLDLSKTPAHELAGLRGVLSQSTAIAFPFTVYEVVQLGLGAGSLDSAGARERIEDALAAVDLAGFGGRFYQDLSGGEAQRVQLARVLVQVWEPTIEGRPRWLFLDEPISALDVKHQIRIMALVRGYARRGGGVFAILHDLNLTAAFADHLILLNEGSVHASGPPSKVLTVEHLESVYGCPMVVSRGSGGAELVVRPRIHE